jgi:hypothetical protein
MVRAYSNTQVLAANAVLTGPWIATTNFSIASPLPMSTGGGGFGGQVAIFGSVYSDHAGSLVLQQSDNTGSANFTNVLSTTAVGAATLVEVASVNVTAAFCRVVYTNGAAAQTTFGLFINMIS